MLITSIPADRYHADSARVENRGPWITTTVPPEWHRIPSALAAATTDEPSSGQYGSANDRCSGPRKNVSARPHVRSTSWSHTTKSPGCTSGRSDPTAHGPSRRVTPTDRMAHTLARKLTWAGPYWWSTP